MENTQAVPFAKLLKKRRKARKERIQNGLLCGALGCSSVFLAGQPIVGAVLLVIGVGVLLTGVTMQMPTEPPTSD